MDYNREYCILTTRYIEDTYISDLCLRRHQRTQANIERRWVEKVRFELLIPEQKCWQFDSEKVNNSS